MNLKSFIEGGELLDQLIFTRKTAPYFTNMRKAWFCHRKA
jgi:hypothetical protein